MPQPLSPSTQGKVTELRGRYHDILSFSNTFHPNRTETFAAHPTRCITGGAPPLVHLRLAYGDGAPIQWLTAHLATWQEKLNVPNKMSASEIESCAHTIANDFYFLKTTEIMLFLAQLLGGKYSVEWHGHILSSTIITTLKERFMPWRIRVIEECEEEAKRQKELEDRKRNPPMSYDEWKKQKESNEVCLSVAPVSPPPSRQTDLSPTSFGSHT